MIKLLLVICLITIQTRGQVSIDLLSHFHGHGEISTYDVDGNKLFVVSGNYLEVFDISIEDKFLKLGEYYYSTDNNSHPTQIKVVGNFLYSNNGNKGLFVIDISDFESIRTRASFIPSITNTAQGFSINNNLIFMKQVIGYGSSSILFADISNPLQINEVGSYTLPFYSESFSIASKDSYMYIVAKKYYEFNYAGADLIIVDISNLNNPVEIYSEHSSYSGIAVKDDYLFTSDPSDKLKIFDTSDKSNPVLINEISYDITSNYTKGISFEIDIDNLVVSQLTETGNRNCWLYYLDSMGNPEIVDSIELDYEINNPHKNIKIKQNKLFTNKNRSVEIYDISSRKIIFEKKLEFLDGFSARDILREDNYAYLLGNNGLYILDVSESGVPMLKSNLNLPTSNSLVKKDQYIYVSGSTDLYIIDVSDPSNPIKTTYLDSYGWSYDVFVKDDFAYLTYSDYDWNSPSDGFKIIDIKDKENPIDLGFVNVGLIGQGIYADSQYVYLVTGAFSNKTPDSTSGLHIYDVSNLADVRQISYLNTPGQCAEIEVIDDFAFIANGDDGVQIVDLSDKFEPKIISSYNINGFTYDIAYDDSLLCVAAGISGLYVLDIRDILLPNLIVNYNSTGITFGVEVENENILIADGNSGIYELKLNYSDKLDSTDNIDKYAEPTLLDNFPNPFNSGTTINYYLPFDTFLEIIIYDALGSEVEILEASNQLKGWHSIIYYPESISSGMYFIALKTNNNFILNKIVYLK